jgi:hypothetical protein
MTTVAPCPSSWVLERYLLDELASDRSPVAEHIATCAECRAKIAAKRADGERYMSSPEAAEVRRLLRASEAIGETGAPRRSSITSRRWLLGSMSLCAAAAVLWAGGRLVSPPDEFAAKGGPVLGLVIERGAEPQRPFDGGFARPGDHLQPILTTSQSGYAALFVGDPRGEVTLLFPVAGGEAAPVPPLAGAPVGGSLHVDGSAATYELSLYFSSRPFALDPLVAAKKAGKAPADFAGVVLTRMLQVVPE